MLFENSRACNIVPAAFEEDADIIGLSVLTGARTSNFGRIRTIIAKNGVGDRRAEGSFRPGISRD